MNKIKTTIQLLSEADYAEWYKLWQSYLTFYQTTLADDITAGTWSKLIDPKVPIYGFGAYKHSDEGVELIGISHVVLHPNTWNNTDCCYLEDLYVDSAARGLGIGRALIQQVYQFAEERNCNRVYWVTDEDNITAHHLYNKLANKTDMVQYRKDLS